MRAYIAIGLLIAALGGFGSWWVQHLRSENTRLAGANTALTEDLARITTERAAESHAAADLRHALAAIHAQKKDNQDALSKAAAAAPDWAAQRVPDGVLDALGVPAPAAETNVVQAASAVP